MSVATHDVLPAKSISRPVGSRRWWRRPWIVPLAILTLAFLAFSLPPYLTLDPRQSRVPQPAGFPLHYPLLVAHVLFGSVAMLTGCAQIWPWLRRRHPGLHRMTGRVYVLGGVLPAGLLGLTIGAVSPFGPVIRVSNVVLATLWLIFTMTGFRMARRRRFVEHRRWMIRSFALTMSIVTNRLWVVIAIIVLTPRLSTTFGGDETLMNHTIAGLAGWLGWALTLLATEWWLARRDPRRNGPLRVPSAPTEEVRERRAV
jgi:hypothetical protein